VIPLKEVATPVFRHGTDTIYRENLQYALSLMGQYRDVGLKMATAGLVMGVKTSVDLPKRYTVEPKGVMLEMLDNIYRLYNGLYLALFLLFILLLLQTRSMVGTFTILMDAPLEWMGAIFMLKVQGFFWSPPVMWGILLATVMVMATGILLVEKTMQLQEAGLDRRSAILTASPIRLRPVLMTTLTTSAAFIPPMLAPPTGMDRFRPISTAIIGALVSSTIMGLIMIPVFYSIFDDIRQFLERVYAGKPFEKKLTGEEFVDERLPTLPTEALWEMRQVDEYKPGVYGFDAALIAPVLEEKEREMREEIAAAALVAADGGHGRARVGGADRGRREKAGV